MKNKELIIFKSEHCLMCGDEIPEGRQVCQNCEKTVFESVSTGAKKLHQSTKGQEEEIPLFQPFQKIW